MDRYTDFYMRGQIHKHVDIQIGKYKDRQIDKLIYIYIYM